MSVQKLSNRSIISNEIVPFTQLHNDVILNIKDNDAFRVWAYLQSKSIEWKVIKSDIKNICNIGDRKLVQIFSYLNRAGLIRYEQRSDELGKKLTVDILVLNGSRFNKNEPFHSEKKQNKQILNKSKAAHAKTARAETRMCGNAGLLNKEVTKERKNETKREQALSQKTRSAPLPDDFVFDLETKALLVITSGRVGLTKEELVAKFKAMVKDKDKRSNDWNAAFQKFLIDERPQKRSFIAKIGEGKSYDPKTNEIKSTVGWFNDNH